MFVNACPTPGTGEIEQPQMLPSKSFSDEFAHAHSSLFCQMQLVAERLLSQLLSFLVCPGGMHKPPPCLSPHKCVFYFCGVRVRVGVWVSLFACVSAYAYEYVDAVCAFCFTTPHGQAPRFAQYSIPPSIHWLLPTTPPSLPK